jgi:superfamily II DNA or RNA helicase
MEIIKIEYVDETYVKVLSSQGVVYELSDHFTFKAKNFFHQAKFRARIWDGNIRLFNRKTNKIYAGLVSQIQEFAKARNYTVLLGEGVGNQTSFSEKEALEFIQKLNLPHEVRDYQLKYFLASIRERRVMNISPTASGKSLIIYLCVMYHLARKRKTLIIVDRINLLNQLASDFGEYGFDSPKYIHKIQGKTEKNSDKPIIISTWQSATKLGAKWLAQFDVVIVDEAHRASAKSVKGILENIPHVKFRLGFTGTLDGSETNEMVLRGLVGPVRQYTTQRELIDRGYNAELHLKILQMVYSEEEKKACKKLDYQKELEFIYMNPKRNQYIKNLALSLKGNTLVVFHRLEKQGIPLYDLINSEANGIPVYYVAGSVDGDEREEIRKIVNEHERSIIVASSGCYSTGVNIPNLHNIISTYPTKAVVTVLQTIGRGLRKTEIKNSVTFFDVVDDLSHKKHLNYVLKHFIERLKIYAAELFEYKIYKVEL